MELSALAGNPRLKELLSHREEGRGLSHAYILAGPAGSGRHTLARILSQAMVCTAQLRLRPCGRCIQCKKAAEGIHPDVMTISGPGEGKPITVDQIRAFRADAYIRPNEGERKVYLLEGADQMNDSAQSAMLKLLEEGPSYAAFLLLAENPGGLLRTVRSRCEVLELTPVPTTQCEQWLRQRYPDKSPADIARAAQDCQGILGRAAAQLEGTAESRDTLGQQAAKLAGLLEQGSELALFEGAMVLEKAAKPDLIPLLELLEGELVRRAAVSGGRKRLIRAVELVKELRLGAQVNANPGQLAGWLCAGMFVDTGTRSGLA